MSVALAYYPELKHHLFPVPMEKRLSDVMSLCFHFRL